MCRVLFVGATPGLPWKEKSRDFSPAVLASIPSPFSITSRRIP